MRHFGSLLLALVFAPAIFLLTGTGLSSFHSAQESGFDKDPVSMLAALGALLLAGVLYGILVMVRLSPVGPGLAGLAAIGISGWALLDHLSYTDTFAQLDVHMGGAVGESGLGILLAVPLLATLTSPRRWRREATPAPAAVATSHQPVYQPAPARPSIPDATKQMQVQPEYLTLPDIAPPSLRYPGSATPPASPPAAPAPPAAAARPATKPAAEPLPKRVPGPPPPPQAQPQPITILSAPTQKVSAGEDRTMKIVPDGEEPTRPIM